MGACSSVVVATGAGDNEGRRKQKRKGTKQLLENVDGNEEEYRKRYMEDHILGQGEFGVVRMVHDMKDTTRRIPLACKYLKKGFIFKDNTLYTPIKPHVLQNEVLILRTLAGTDFCLRLHSTYESKKTIYIITELCSFSMMEWVANQPNDLKTEDVSRIAYELLIAINHCATHKVIHRDIKPENIMFQHHAIHSPLRLIDFGSGTIHTPTAKEEQIHTTFAGSAFYISPEMFQRTYTSKTDIWSVGVTLYVLVAGYPADNLQQAFNVLHASKNRNLKQQLPNLPQNLPGSFYELLDSCLYYRHKKRKLAKEILDTHSEFLFFHQDYFNNTEEILTEITSYHHHQQQQQQQDEQEETTATAADSTMVQQQRPEQPNKEEEDEQEGISIDQIAAIAASSLTTATTTAQNTNSIHKKQSHKRTHKRTSSVTLEGSVQRHTLFLDYVKYERSLTTLLATILTTKELYQLMKIIQKEHIITTTTTNANKNVEEEAMEEDKLKVIQVHVLKEILENNIKNSQIIPMIKQLKNSEKYNVFAYHIHLLEDFISGKGKNKDGSNNPSYLKRQKIFDFTNPRKRYNHQNEYSNNSVGSENSISKGLKNALRGFRKNALPPGTVEGGNNTNALVIPPLSTNPEEKASNSMDETVATTTTTAAVANRDAVTTTRIEADTSKVEDKDTPPKKKKGHRQTKSLTYLSTTACY